MKNYKEKSVQTPMLNVLCIPNYLKQSPRGLPTNKPSYKKKRKLFISAWTKTKIELRRYSVMKPQRLFVQQSNIYNNRKVGLLRWNFHETPKHLHLKLHRKKNQMSFTLIFICGELKQTHCFHFVFNLSQTLEQYLSSIQEKTHLATTSKFNPKLLS